MKKSHEEGTFELITGPMFSGKTTTLVKKLNFFQNEGYKIKCFKPAVDDRYDLNKVVTHEAIKVKATPIKSAKEILNHIDECEVIFIDEIQFFDPSIVSVVLDLISNNYIVVGAGLEYDYMGNNFGEMDKLKRITNTLSRLTGSCSVCNNVGTHTYRKNKNVVDTVLIGSNDVYEIRCETCFELEQ